MVKRDCPLCKKSLASLRNHLTQVHKLKDITERRHWLDRARYRERAKREEISKFYEENKVESAAVNQSSLHPSPIGAYTLNDGIPVQQV